MTNPLDKLREMRVLFPDMDVPDASGSSALYREWKKLRDAELACPVTKRVAERAPKPVKFQPGSIPFRVFNRLNGSAVSADHILEMLPSLTRRQALQASSRLVEAGMATRVGRGEILKVNKQSERVMAHGQRHD